MGENELASLQKRVEEVERDLALSKQQMLKTLQLISENFSKELSKLLEDQRDSLLEIAVDTIHRNLDSKSR